MALNIMTNVKGKTPVMAMAADKTQSPKGPALPEVKKREVPPDMLEALRALTPSTVCNLAYSMYVCTAEEQNGRVTSIGRTAKSTVLDFEALERWVKSRGGSRERRFLFLIRLSAVSLSRGLFRRKQEQHMRASAAEEERARSLKQEQLSSGRSVFFSTAWRAFSTGGVGFLLAKTFAPDFLKDTGHGPTTFSLAVGITALLAYYYLRSLYMQRADHRIYTLYEMAKRFAVEESEIGSQDEYVRTRREVSDAWRDYFGCRPKSNSLDFGHLLEDNIDRRRDHERQMQRIRMGEWYYIATSVTAAYREARKFRKQATTAANGLFRRLRLKKASPPKKRVKKT